jgi:hypothetical protein
MKKKLNLETLKPHLIALVLFAIVSFGYFSPVLDGKMLRQGDMMAYAGAVQELKELQAETGEYALWTDRMFGGMPTFLINNPGHANLTKYVHNILNLNHPRPANHIFLYMVGFYIALLLFGVSPWTSIAGAFAYAFSTYFIIIIDAGHITKVMALGYMPLVIAAAYHAFTSNRLRGSVLMGIALSLQMYVNHLQITYYTFIIVAFMGLFEFGSAFLAFKLKEFGKTMAYLSIAALLALASNTTTLWTVYEYGQYSMRGKPNLVDHEKPKTTGLPIDYITAWSYGKVETLNLLVPNLKGGSSHMQLGNGSETYKAIERNYGKQSADQYAKYLDTYWGDQPFTSGPVYIGASVILLFLLAMFLLKGNLKWWMLLATILAILLAWGRHFMWFNEIFIHSVPGYNKFRTVSMILVIVQFTMPVLGIMAFDKILKDKLTFAQVKRPLYISTTIVFSILLLILIVFQNYNEIISTNNDLPSFLRRIFVSLGEVFHFKGSSDSRMPDVIQKSLQADRLSMLRSDVFRSLLFMLVASGLIWFLAKNKLNKMVAVTALGLLFAADLIPVTLRYSQNENWVPRRELQQQPFKPTAADREILKDKEHFRVLNLAANTFNDAGTSYYHNSIGGYHGAKMQRYQELIEKQIQPSMMQMFGVLKATPTYESVDSLMRKLDVLNMLNTRYYILSPDNQPLKNPHAFGQAWFVDDIVWADSANHEMNLLSDTDLQRVAVMDKQFHGKVGESVKNVNTKSIKMESYSANRLKYSYESETDALAIFSEIYYPKGWEATINGQPAEILRANYLLRSVVLPAGKGTVEFEFRPKSYFVGNAISYASSAILLILGLWVLITSFKAKKDE